MKYLKIPLLMSFLLSLIGCEKEEPINITLYNQPLEVVQKYIHGEWKSTYAIGGFGGVDKIYCDSSIIEFTTDNRYLFRYNDGPYLIDAVMNWKRVYDRGINDSIWLWDFSGASYIFQKIFSDTLVYSDYYVLDGYSFHWIKVK